MAPIILQRNQGGGGFTTMTPINIDPRADTFVPSLAPRVGRYYRPYNFGKNAVMGATTQTGVMVFVPIIFSQKFTADAISTRVSTLSAGGSYQAAIYADLNGLPTGLPLAKTANIPTDAAAQIETILDKTVQVGPGSAGLGPVGWLGVNSDNNVYRYHALDVSQSMAIVGDASNAEATSLAYAGAIQKAQTFGTWPDLTGVTAYTSSQNSVGLFGSFRAASVP